MAGAQGYAALTFDYRGMGDRVRSSGLAARLRRRPVRLGRRHRRRRSTRLARAPDVPLYVVGHSLGAQLPGCSRTAIASPAWSTIAAGSGYWRDNAPPLKRIVLYFWHVLVPLAAACSATFRARSMGKVGDLPRGVVLQWRRWCLNPRYHVGAEGRGAARVVFAGALSDARAVDHRRRADDRARHARADRLLRERAARECSASRRPTCRRAASATSASSASSSRRTLWTRVTAMLPQFSPHANQETSHEHQDCDPERRRDDRDRAPGEEERDHVAMYQAMASALRAAQDDAAVRAVLITGQPGIFTSGNDLEDFVARPRRAAIRRRSSSCRR